MFNAITKVYIPAIKLQEQNKAENKMVIGWS